MLLDLHFTVPLAIISHLSVYREKIETRIEKEEIPMKGMNLTNSLSESAVRLSIKYSLFAY